jgi:DNA-binding response OmpR family regulator
MPAPSKRVYIDKANRLVVIDDARKRLSPRAIDMFSLLWRRTPLTVTRDHLHHAIHGWREDGGPDPKVFDVYAHHIRQALQGTLLHLEIVYGEGWRLAFRDTRFERGVHSRRGKKYPSRAVRAGDQVAATQ